jgi:hypothetical protein
MFGGKSTWRRPVRMPVNASLIRSLLNPYQFCGDEFRVECSTRSETYMTVLEVAKRSLTGSRLYFSATRLEGVLSTAGPRSCNEVRSGRTTFYFASIFMMITEPD